MTKLPRCNVTSPPASSSAIALAYRPREAIELGDDERVTGMARGDRLPEPRPRTEQTLECSTPPFQL